MVRDPSSPLTVLTERLEAELDDHATSLALTLHHGRLTVAYHQVVILHWRIVCGELVCVATGWRRKTYVAQGPVQAREIAISLVFEFVRQFGKPATDVP
jgi:hypothetical protein